MTSRRSCYNSLVKICFNFVRNLLFIVMESRLYNKTKKASQKALILIYKMCILFSDVISDPDLFYCDRDDNELPGGEVSFQMMTFTKILYEKNSSKCRQLQSVKSQSWRNRNTPRMHSEKYKVKRYFSGNYRKIRGEMI